MDKHLSNLIDIFFIIKRMIVTIENLFPLTMAMMYLMFTMNMMIATIMMTMVTMMVQFT